jgi:hypothetical protein
VILMMIRTLALSLAVILPPEHMAIKGALVGIYGGLGNWKREE